MTWTDTGVVQVGVLPDTPPTAPPSTPWFIEPVLPHHAIDAGLLGKLVTAMRREHVPGLSLAGLRAADALGELHDLPELTALVLSDSDVGGAALATLQVSLHRLYLARTAIDDLAIQHVAIAHPQLEVIDLEDTAVGDVGVRALTTIGSLHAANLAGTAITDTGGAELAASAHLEILDLGRTQVAGKTVAAVRGLALRQLFLDTTRVPAADLAKLAPLAPTLVRLDVAGLPKPPTDADLAWLATAPNLVEAGLNGAQVHDAFVRRLLAGAALRELRIAGAPIGVAIAHEIGKRAELEVVDLGDTLADDVAATALLAHPNLRILRLDHTKVTDAGLAVSPPDSLVELYLTKTAVTDRGLAILDQLPQLQGLGLGETAVAGPTIERIARLAHLQTLVLTHVRPPDAAVFAQLGVLHELGRLYLDDARVGDAEVAAFTDLLGLRVLHLSGTDVSDEAIATLHRFVLLEELTIGDTRVRDGIADLTAWPHLRTLSLLGLGIGDPGLAALARRPSLTALDLSSTTITDPAALVALPRLRTLGLVADKLSAAGFASAKQLAARGVEIVR